MGLAIGGAYLSGGLARAAVNHARIEALADKANGSLSERALASTAGDAGVLAIARRVDGTAPTAQDLADRRLARLALQTGEPTPAVTPSAPASVPQTEQPGKLFRVAVTVAQPFHLQGALEDSRDLECLTQAVYYEARGESAAGQQAVAQVVLNRVRHPAFPKSVCGVVFQHAGGGCQFSFACDGSTGRHVESGAWNRSRKVAADALDGHVVATIGNATHFHVASLGKVWASGMMQVAQIGSHVFFRFGGAAGAPKMFHAEPQLSAPLQIAERASQPRVVTASFSPLGGDRLASASSALVERAAAAVESVTKPAPKVETPKVEAKPETTPAKGSDSAAVAAPATAG